MPGLQRLYTHCERGGPALLNRALRAAPLQYIYGIRNLVMLALRLPPEIEQRLDALAKKTGRSKSWFACEAILRQIEDIEDEYIARHRGRRGRSRVRLESMERDLARRSKS